MLGDTDWGSDLDERKATSTYSFLLDNGVITWSSKKQPLLESFPLAATQILPPKMDYQRRLLIVVLMKKKKKKLILVSTIGQH